MAKKVNISYEVQKFGKTAKKKPVKFYDRIIWVDKKMCFRKKFCRSIGPSCTMTILFQHLNRILNM